jgi:hypothetical protein
MGRRGGSNNRGLYIFGVERRNKNTSYIGNGLTGIVYIHFKSFLFIFYWESKGDEN